MTYEKECQTKTLGVGKCGNCGFENARIVQMKNGLICSQCPDDFDGGCKTQIKADSDKSALIIAGRVRRWRSQEDKARILGGGPKAPEPDDEPEQPKQEKSFLEDLLS